MIAQDSYEPRKYTKFDMLYPGVHTWIGHFCEEQGLPLKNIERDACGIKVDTGKGRYRIHRHTIERLSGERGEHWKRLRDYIVDVHKRTISGSGDTIPTYTYFNAGLA